MLETQEEMLRQGLYVHTVDPLSDRRWDRFVSSHPAGSIYHHSGWIGSIRETYGYVLECFLCEDGNGIVRGILPTAFVRSRWTGRRLISFPFSPYCGALARDEEALECLLAEAVRRAEALKADRLQLRWGEEPPGALEKFQRQDFYSMYVLDLRPHIDEIFGALHKSSVQRPIRKSEKGGLVLQAGASEEEMRRFYRLQVMTRKKHGIPPQPYAYFENLRRALGATDRCRVYTAWFEKAAVAAILLLRFGNTVMYQNGGSDPRSLHLKPNHFLLWRAVEDAKAEGFRFFNFGTCTPRDAGLIRFKRQWGTEERSVPYFYHPDPGGGRNGLEASWGYRAATAVLRRMPSRLLIRIGEWTYKHAA